MHTIVLEREPTFACGQELIKLLEFGLSQHGHSVSLLYEKEGNLLKQYQEFVTT